MYAPRLGAILSSLVMSGISNHFLIPFTATESTEIFLKNIKSIEKGGEPGSVVMWVAKVLEDGLPSLDLDGKETGHGEIVGSVQLAFHVSPNGRFRGEVRKLIVDERYQRRGVGRLLMRELENPGREMGITLCVSRRLLSLLILLILLLVSDQRPSKGLFRCG